MHTATFLSTVDSITLAGRWHPSWWLLVITALKATIFHFLSQAKDGLFARFFQSHLADQMRSNDSVTAALTENSLSDSTNKVTPQMPEDPHSAALINQPEASPLPHPLLNIAPCAAHKIAQEGAPLRITVKSGGCSGLRYVFAFDTVSGPQDYLFETLVPVTARVVIDSLSMAFLQDATLFFQDELMASSFSIRNPNATGGCGCGDSFSIF